MSKFAYTEAIAENLASFAEDEFQHQIKVLRRRTGDQIDFFDGRGGCFQGSITTIENRKKWFQAEITESRIFDQLPPLHLLVALPRNGKLDTIIQKSVELGVTMITPLITTRTTVRLEKEKKLETRKEHWQRIAVASMKQSGNPYLPEINRPKKIEELNSEPETSFPRNQIVFHPAAKNLRSLAELNLTRKDAVVIALGPEGGFSPDEIDLLSSLGFVAAGLGERILRLETAVVAALTLVQYFRNSF